MKKTGIDTDTGWGVGYDVNRTSLLPESAHLIKTNSNVPMQTSQPPLVLYIEDNQDNRKLIKKLLQASGMNVHTEQDGIGGLAYLQHTKPDLILMDIGMPHMDGYTTTALIREQPALKSVPVIAVTAHILRRDEEKTISAGCDGFIQKPIDVDQFPDQVLAFLDRVPG